MHRQHVDAERRDLVAERCREGRRRLAGESGGASSFCGIRPRTTTRSRSTAAPRAQRRQQRLRHASVPSTFTSITARRSLRMGLPNRGGARILRCSRVRTRAVSVQHLPRACDRARSETSLGCRGAAARRGDLAASACRRSARRATMRPSRRSRGSRASAAPMPLDPRPTPRASEVAVLCMGPPRRSRAGAPPAPRP